MGIFGELKIMRHKTQEIDINATDINLKIQTICPHCLEIFMKYFNIAYGNYYEEIKKLTLKEHRYNINSQFGEDGVIGHLMESFGINNGIAVEVGAGDGILYSNILHLIKRGFSSLSIEGDVGKFQKLKQNYKEYINSVCHNDYVSLEIGHSLNDILKYYSAPIDFDFLSLDIDGNDFWVWTSLIFEPKIVMIEYNSSFQGDITIPYNKNHRWDETMFFGASASLFKKLGEYRGYDLVCVLHNNMIFVKKYLNNGKYPCVGLEECTVNDNQHNQMSEEQKKSLVSINWDEFCNA